MPTEVTIALAGICGYGDQYLEVLLARGAGFGVRLAGVVDPAANRSKRLGELHELGIPLFKSTEDLYAAVDRVDLMMVVTPIHLHAPLTCFALKQGSSVLCEKPLAGTLRDAARMQQAQQRARANQFTAIGYQWSFSEAIQSLKRDVSAGLFGKPKRLRSLMYAPRPTGYFRRNDWVGRIRTDAGDVVLDSPVNNATSHFLHNMLYVLGKSRAASATPRTVEAELYRANDIENYDTAAMRCTTDDGVEVLFYTSHAVPDRRGPLCRFEFEQAVVDYDGLGAARFVARFANGEVRNYGSPNIDRHEKIWQSVDSVRSGRPTACGIDASLPHTLCVVAAQESSARITDFPAHLKRAARIDDEPAVVVEGLSAALLNCYELALLPSEIPSLPWATPATPIDLTSPAWTARDPEPAAAAVARS